MIPSALSSSLPAQEEDSLEDDFFDPFAGLLGQHDPSDDLWLGKPAPRYTSYPPATAFENFFTAEHYRQLLATIPPEDPVSLYIHIPFCQKLCLYCGCHTCPTQRHELIDNYLIFLHREIENLAAEAPRARKVSRIHFGGGSPNILSEKDMGLMIGALVRRFDLAPLDEMAMELDPRLITKAQARVLGMMGITRASLGIQDFDPDVQQAIGRIHPYEEIAERCLMLRDEGIGQISFDLMYGLPLQSPASMRQTARQAIGLRPQRISLFSYAHIPHVKKHQKALEKYILPSPYAALQLEKAAREELTEAGYIEIGMDHFALPGDPLAKALYDKKLKRTFQGYTDDNAAHLLGLGASSIGKSRDIFIQNAHDLEDYKARIRTHGFATARGKYMDAEDKFRGEIISSLMCFMKVNLEALCFKYNFALTTLASALTALRPFEDAHLVRREGYILTLETPNRMAVRMIASLFDTYTRAENAPVSRVV